MTSNDNIVRVDFVKKKNEACQQRPTVFYKSPKGSFPVGTIPCWTVKVDMAVGMYQFHDLLANHRDPTTQEFLTEYTQELNDNNVAKDFGLLNI